MNINYPTIFAISFIWQLIGWRQTAREREREMMLIMVVVKKNMFFNLEINLIFIIFRSSSLKHHWNSLKPISNIYQKNYIWISHKPYKYARLVLRAQKEHSICIEPEELQQNQMEFGLQFCVVLRSSEWVSALFVYAIEFCCLLSICVTCK